MKWINFMQLVRLVSRTCQTSRDATVSF